MKRIFVYFLQMGGVNALAPLLEACKTRYEVIVSGREQTSSYFAEKGFKIILPGEFSDEHGECHQFKDLSLDMVITDITYLSRYPEGKTCRKIWKMAALSGISSVCYVDNWFVSWQRFCLEGEKSPPEILPDYIAVLDEIVKSSLLSLGFTEKRVVVTGSPRFVVLAKEAREIDVAKRDSIRRDCGFSPQDFIIFFISEPLEQVWGLELGFTERTVLKDVFDVIGQLPREIKQKLVFIIVPHPEEDSAGLRAFAQSISAGIRLRFSDKNSVMSVMPAAHLVLGMSSMLLVEAVIMRLPVISLQMGAKREDMLITNKMAATLKLHSSRQLVPFLSRAINDSAFREHLVNLGGKFRFVGDSFLRWERLIQRILN